MSAAALPVRSVRSAASAAPAWLTAGTSLLLAVALYAAGRGALLRLEIPAGAALIGLSLYLRRPVAYLHFTLWTWFLTPFVRRLVDWRMGFEDQNLVLVAPLLVSGIAGLTLLREREATPSLRLTPFLLCASGVLYGLAVGTIRCFLHEPDAPALGELVFGLCKWIAPLLFGLHLYLRWPMYQEHRRAIQTSFLWATLLLGAYGVYQYIQPPPWDTYWLASLPGGLEVASFGHPAPYQIRVWSTLNAPGPFANFIMAGLLIVSASRSRWKMPAFLIAIVSFLLSLVRTAWLSYFVGLFAASNAKQRRGILRTLLLLAAAVCCLFLLAKNTEVSGVVGDRFGSLSNLGADESAQERLKMYGDLANELVHLPTGIGLSNRNFYHNYALDSGFVRMILDMGFLGTLLFLCGAFALVRTARRGNASEDSLLASSKGIMLAFLLQLLGGEIFTGLAGFILWLTIGYALSASAALGAPGQEAPDVSSISLHPHAREQLAGF